MIMKEAPTSGKPAKLTCVCCGEETVNRGGYCGFCHIPLEVSRSVESRGVPAKFVSVLGASGAGKTVYLGFLLDILTKGNRGLRGLPNGAFSVGVQQQTITSLQNRRFPQKTPSESDSWQWVHCEVSHEARPKQFYDIITPDFAGEAVAIEVERPKTNPTIRAVARQSQALLILFDSQRVRDAGREEDFFAMKLASYIAELHSRNGSSRWGKAKLPIAIVFTKSDVCPEATENPADFAAANMPGLTQACKRNFANHKFFAAGIVGSSVTVTDEFGCRVLVPLHVEPHGIIEPLDWITERL